MKRGVTDVYCTKPVIFTLIDEDHEANHWYAKAGTVLESDLIPDSIPSERKGLQSFDPNGLPTKELGWTEIWPDTLLKTTKERHCVIIMGTDFE